MRPEHIHIHQIFYDQSTQKALDPGFLPLDNRSNQRPDWREYASIGPFLEQQPLIEDDYYGFFSPKFHQKTQLTSRQVFDYITASDPAIDVFLFSPFPDYSAVFLNVFEQGEMWHPGLLALAQHIVPLLHKTPKTPLPTQIINDSRTTVFCNYFVAKPAFWRAWDQLASKLFALAENTSGEWAAPLNQLANYDGGDVCMKLFILERLASFLLATQPQWKTRAFDFYKLPASYPPLMQAHSLEILTLDALKTAFLTQGLPAYRQAFDHMQSHLFERIKELQKADGISLLTDVCA